MTDLAVMPALFGAAGFALGLYLGGRRREKPVTVGMVDDAYRRGLEDGRAEQVAEIETLERAWRRS